MQCFFCICKWFIECISISFSSFLPFLLAYSLFVFFKSLVLIVLVLPVYNIVLASASHLITPAFQMCLDYRRERRCGTLRRRWCRHCRSTLSLITLTCHLNSGNFSFAFPNFSGPVRYSSPSRSTTIRTSCYSFPYYPNYRWICSTNFIIVLFQWTSLDCSILTLLTWSNTTQGRQQSKF